MAKYKRTRKKNYKKSEIIDIIEDVFNVYTNRNAPMSWQMILLERHKITPQLLNYWIQKYPDIKTMIDELIDVREVKLMSTLMEGQGNVTGAIFVCKCHHGWVAEETKLQLSNDKDIADLKSDTVINIGWSDGEDKS